MARIRSIKPDFFTSETICALPLSTRLTFIGLWTHVDDNGVTVDNAKLIMAAIWPLEDDPRETLARTLEDLRRLSAAGLIVRYEHAGKRLLFVSGWDEHQKVSHPGKARYPRPPEGYVSSEDADPPETLARPSGDSPEILRPEQGAGSRDKGAGSPPSAALALARREVPPETSQELIAEWIEHCRKRPPGNVIGQVGKQIKAMLAEGIDPADVRTGLAEWWRKGLHPSALPSVVNEFMNADRSSRPSARPSGDIDWDAAMARAQAREANAS